MEMTKLEMFAFDVLGDLIPIRAYEVTDVHGHDVILVNTARIGVPIDMIHDEWKHAIEGTEFENVVLYTC